MKFFLTRQIFYNIRCQVFTLFFILILIILLNAMIILLFYVALFSHSFVIWLITVIILLPHDSITIIILKITIFKVIMRSRDLPSIRNSHYSTYLILAFVTLFWTLFFRQCTGIPLLIYWVKPWNVLMEDVYVMGPQSNKGSFMICSWMEGGLEYHWSIYYFNKQAHF